MKLPFGIFLPLFFLVSFAQAQVLTQRRVWDGPFDIKTIGAPNLVPVYLNTIEMNSNQLLADSLIRQETIDRAGRQLIHNNIYKPFGRMVLIPKSALLCKGDPDVGGCMDGLTRSSPSSTCPVKYSIMEKVEMGVAMSYSDFDEDLSTFSSSMAWLNMPPSAEVEAAYLYWTGEFQGSNLPITLLDGPTNSYSGSGQVFNVGAASGYTSVKFKVPGGSYQTVTASQTFGTTAQYVCVSDITPLLQGIQGGECWLANLQSYPVEGAGGSSSGWSLFVVYRSPNKPTRMISLWDGLQSVSTQTSLVLSGFTSPATTNETSFVGFAATDGEDVAAVLTGAVPPTIGFKTTISAAIAFNQMMDQAPHRLYDYGYPADCFGNALVDECRTPLFDTNWCAAYDGPVCSHITSYDPATNKNGNEVVRLPSNSNTLGFDLHHIKLPNGAMGPNATSATLTMRVGGNGTFDLFMAYISVEKAPILTSLTNEAVDKSGALISIVPQPLHDVSTLYVHSSSEGAKSVETYTLTGTLIKIYPSVPKEGLEVYKSDFKPGIYLLKITETSGRVGHSKLIVD